VGHLEEFLVMPRFGNRHSSGIAAPGVCKESAFGRRIDGLAGRRHARRQQVILAASAQAIDCSRSVVISDLSPQGAKLQGRGLPLPGREVLITAGSIDVFATVAWSEKDECGLRFDSPLDDALLKLLQHEGRWTTVTGSG
jgi:hypothetical protein